MNMAREQALARPGFSKNEHGRLASSYTVSECVSLQDAGTRALHGLATIVSLDLRKLLAPASGLEYPRDDVLDRGRRERFGKVVGCAGAHRLDRVVDGRVGGHDDHLRAGSFLGQRAA